MHNQEIMTQHLIHHIRKRAQAETLWVAPMVTKPRYGLQNAEWFNHNLVQLVEIYKNFETSARYARIYMLPTSHCVPTIIVGEVNDIERIAKRDGKLPILLHECTPIHIEQEVAYRYWKDLGNLSSSVVEFFSELKNAAYTVRPCTFVMAEMVALCEAPAVLKVYIDSLNQKSGEMFTHLSAKNEAHNLIPSEPIHTLAGTNSCTYQENQKHLQWQTIIKI